MSKCRPLMKGETRKRLAWYFEVQYEVFVFHGESLESWAINTTFLGVLGLMIRTII